MTGSETPPDLLGPLADLQKTLVLQSPVLWTDDTHVLVLGGDKPGSTKGRFWAYIGDADHPYSVYDFTMSRARDGPATFLADYRGFLQARCLRGLRRDLPGLGRADRRGGLLGSRAAEVPRGAVEHAA